MRPRTRLAVLIVLLAAGVAMVGAIRSPWSDASSSPTLPWAPQVSPFTSSHPVKGRESSAHHVGRPGAADGVVPDGTTVFSNAPAVARLDPALRSALRSALRKAAAEADIRFEVNSGWRSPAYQEQLLDEAIAKYGSKEKAARWVATPTTSSHVSGDAVDLGPSAATTWLAKHGAAYGLCRTYDNEPWHFELRPDAVRHGCPDRYANPSEDPRLQ